MCGIAGLTYNAAGESAPFDWNELKQQLERFLSLNLEAGPEGLKPALEALEGEARRLREYPVLRQLMLRQDLQQMLSEMARRLAGWQADLERSVLKLDLPLELLEQWNAVGIRLRDLAWGFEQDALGAVHRTLRLLPPARKEESKACLEAWKLAATLENIGRLEVRGRDSLGFSVLVAFADAAALADFEQWVQAEHPHDWARRREAMLEFTDRAIVSDERSLAFAFKVAMEVGALGDNVAALSQSMQSDAIFWEALNRETEVNLFTHTRWASNGIISEPNCHPVTELTLQLNGKAEQAAPSPHRILAALNGDVDNYQELVARLQSQYGRTIPSRISTDTKIIPVMVDIHFRDTQDLTQAFCRAVHEFEGSIAIVMHSSVDPHKTYLALRGSGQSMFVGLCAHGYVFASELYGVVEQTNTFIRMDGTNERGGQVLVLDSREQGAEAIEAYWFDGQRQEAPLKVQTAEITTRDINRGQFSHFLLKEISEAPESVKKTIQGKFSLGDDYKVTMNLGEAVLPADTLQRLRSGQIKRVFLIGQGTAAVAGMAVAPIMQRALAGRLTVTAIKATELSGYAMENDFSNALVVAISQSGTTTDTNRTVDMLKARGAAVIAIVNRRNSDLVYKVDGVLYTSDGRDIEMSVASTKAFYSQVVAGYLLTYQLALHLQLQPEEEIYRELGELVRLPGLMRSVLSDQAPIQRLAEQYAPTRRDWAVVGSGCTRAAADEIRIKLSELCYKSIATDYIEDKKHIDLSSEPLTLVCCAGLPVMALKDAVKEVAIFKSHKSIPIVICSENFDAFERYAAGVLYVPRTSEAASVLLNTLVGHLWGYYCAQAIDRGAEQLRHARALGVQYLTQDQPRSLPPRLLKQVMGIGQLFQDNLMRGRFNSSLSVQVGAQLSNLFQYFTGAQSLRQFSLEFRKPGTAAGVAETLVTALSEAIQELARPIDAIKHQAKTITVGISRLDDLFDGVLFEALRELNLSPDSIPYRDLLELRAMTPAVQRVAGVTVYSVNGLGSLGEPLPSTQVKTVSKSGQAASMKSRADAGVPLMGTKELVVRRASAYIGLGRKDRRPIAIIPVNPRGLVERIVLLHMEFVPTLPVDRKVAILRDTGRYDELKTQITETDLEWKDDYLERIPVDELVTLPVDKLVEEILGQLSVSRG